MRKVPGIDFSSGSIGHALSGGLGMALGAALDRRELQGLRAARRRRDAGRARSGRRRSAPRTTRPRSLIAIIDRNGFQLDGKVDDVIGVEPLDEKWRAFGWEVHSVDGHDVAALTAAAARAQGRRHARAARPASSPRPSRARASPTWRPSPAGISATSIRRTPKRAVAEIKRRRSA